MKKLVLALGLLALAACQQQTGLSPQALREAGQTYIAVLEAKEVSPSRFAEGLAALERAHGLAIPAEDRLEALGMVILRGLSPAKAERLAQDPRVYGLTPDREVWAFAQTVPWGVERVGAPTTTAKGAGVSIYILDTGIKVGHEDLTNLAGGHAVVKCRGRCRAPYDDDNGHGTHVAGTAAAVNNNVGVLGVAPAAELWAVKVLSNSGSGSISGIVQGLNWVIAHDNGGKPKVINMSLGGRGRDDQDGQYCPANRSTDAFHNAIQKAVCDHNITVVVAAGNDGADAANYVPAAYDEVLTVSATNSQDDWPSWSNYGPDVDLAAPGVSILSTWHTSTSAYNTLSGTSMASPHVAGAAALVLSLHPHSTPAQVRQTLLQNAESTASWTNTSGKPHPEPFLNVRGF
ncbi:S8 family peptidase [Thermus thermamylovorans]|uniref:Subtilisin BPN n=1 Tax=Thermus thermamylovorans TaxID=2509362 RepID=A0A4Q9B6V9_9DEIN|nr:S8 family peptidase [Thermus thermamylovorans]TBH20489.1 subtilisin BPN' [Thermus thermamylovorans]